jgi:MFS family permease
VLGDRWGRVKTMLLTILIYSIFTGLSALSVGVYDFMTYRLLTGLGVGGEFAVGVALLAEVLPDRARPRALGLLQAFSAVGNCTAAGLFILLGFVVQNQPSGASYDIPIFGNPVAPWRLMFLFGIAPAILALLVRRRLREPERWQKAVAGGQAHKAGSYRELFGDPRWRKHAIVGLCLAFAGVVGLWGIGFFSADLVAAIFKKSFAEEGLKGNDLAGQAMIWAGLNQLMLNIGAFFGIYAFSRITHVTGRRPAFVISFLLAMVSTAGVYWFLSERSDIFWMIPIMGFCQLAVFGGYAIYFPELFPTRLRSTGTSFCYNVGRLVAAVGPLMLAQLKADMMVYRTVEDPNRPFRLAGVLLSTVFLIGVVAVWFAPETKDKPLPE